MKYLLNFKWRIKIIVWYILKLIYNVFIKFLINCDEETRKHEGDVLFIWSIIHHSLCLVMFCFVFLSHQEMTADKLKSVKETVTFCYSDMSYHIVKEYAFLLIKWVVWSFRIINWLNSHLLYYVYVFYTFGDSFMFPLNVYECYSFISCQFSYSIFMFFS